MQKDTRNSRQMRREELAAAVLRELRKAIPSPETELRYLTPYELLVAVILSAQCTDERVNKVTPALFEEFPVVEALSKAEPEDIYPFIRSISYPNNKSKHLSAMAKKVVADFGGEIPDTVDELVTLNGVGRKTAQVVASVAFNRDALPVDTHVFRVANRIGLARQAPTTNKVEKQLKKFIPQAAWSEGHHLLILHGRYTCTARNPNCAECNVSRLCGYYKSLRKLPQPLVGLNPRRGKYYCKSRKHYFDVPVTKEDRNGITQIACPKCHSMNVFETKTGSTTKRVRDFRV